MSSQEVADTLATHKDRDDESVDDDVHKLATLLGDQDNDRINDEQELIGFGVMINNMHIKNPNDVLTLPGENFVDALSKINIVHNTTMDTHLTSLDDLFPSKVPMGNSRNYPSMHLVKCPTKMCNYRHQIKSRVDDYIPVCCSKVQLKETFPCHGEGCEKTFGAEKLLTDHVRDTHDWTKKGCPYPECIDSAVVTSCSCRLAFLAVVIGSSCRLGANPIALLLLPVDPNIVFDEC